MGPQSKNTHLSPHMSGAEQSYWLKEQGVDATARATAFCIAATQRSEPETPETQHNGTAQTTEHFPGHLFRHMLGKTGEV